MDEFLAAVNWDFVVGAIVGGLVMAAVAIHALHYGMKKADAKMALAMRGNVAPDEPLPDSVERFLLESGRQTGQIPGTEIRLTIECTHCGKDQSLFSICDAGYCPVRAGKPFGDSPDTDAVYHTNNCPECGAPPSDCYNVAACKFWWDSDNAVWKGYP